MADGIELNAGTGGAVVNTDDIASVHTQITKPGFGALDSLTLAASGAGAVSAGVQRVTLASDDPAVTDLAAIEVLLGTIDADTGNIVTSVQLIDNAIAAVDDAAGATQTGIPALAVRDDSLTSRTEADGDLTQLRTDSGGRLWAKLDSQSTGVGVTGPLTDTELRATAVPVSLASVPSHAVTNAGTFAVQVDAAIPAGDNNIGNVDIASALPAGTNAIGKLAANSGVDIGDVDVTSISAGTNAIGNVGLIGRTTGGMTIFRSIDIDETEEEIKAAAGQLFSIAAFNTTAAPLYLKFYNATAANVTVGTTTPVLTFVVPGNADSDGAGFIWNNDIGFAFGTAITVACTTGVADNDTGAPGANACIVNVGYA